MTMMMIMCLAVAYLITNATIDTAHALKGKVSPRQQRKNASQKMRHDWMRTRSDRSPSPRPSRGGGARAFMAARWSDAWDTADRRYTGWREKHETRRDAGDLPRQRAARWTGQQVRRGATGTTAALTRRGRNRHDEEDAPQIDTHQPEEDTTPDTPAEPTHPQAAPERSNVIPLRATPDASTPTEPEQENPSMSMQSGEITSLDAALDYCKAMSEHTRAELAALENDTAGIRTAADNSAKIAASAETAIGSMHAVGVEGEALAAFAAASEQMEAVQKVLVQAAEKVAAAAESYSAVATAYDSALAEFKRHMPLQEAFASVGQSAAKDSNFYNGS